MSNRIINGLEETISEATRFLKRAKAAKAQFETMQEGDWCSPSFAAAKRASMDLTRLLAKLRRGFREL